MPDPINKSIPGMLAVASLALASGSAMPKNAPKPPAESIQAPTSKPWTPDGLDPELHPIAHLESSFGKNMRHAQHPKGVFHTAYGACGLKPVTAHEQYLRTPTIQRLFPNLTKPEVFQQHFLEDHTLYNLTASAHWQWLRKRLGTPAKAAFGWRWGGTAAKRAPDQVIHEDPYVEKFLELSAGKLGKMAINDVTPGKKKGKFLWDYTHLLTPENKMAGYQIMVSFRPAAQDPSDPKTRLYPKRDLFRGEVLHNSKPVGFVSAGIHTKCEEGLCIEPHSEIQEGHHNRGLGTAMYEAVFKEAKLAGVKNVHGHIQSEAAIRLHTALARKHGMGYKPYPTYLKDSPRGEMTWLYGNYPGGEYQYTIKSEPLAKEDSEESDIRALLSTDNLQDWTMALKRPGATHADMDHLLDRISQTPLTPGSTAPIAGGELPRTVLRELMESPQWGRQHHARAMLLPVFRNHGNTLLFAQHYLADESTVDRILEDVDVWAPLEQQGRITDRARPYLNYLLYQSPRTSVSQFDKIIQISAQENHTDGVPFVSTWFNRFNQTEDPIAPEFLHRWFDLRWGADKSQFSPALARQCGRRANQAPGLFEKILKADPDVLEIALNAYAREGSMTEENFRHLLAHPGSLSKPAAYRMDDPATFGAWRADVIQSAIFDGLDRTESVSPETAESVVNHPNSNFRSTLAERGGLPAEVYRKLYADPILRPKFILEKNCPEDLRLDHIKNVLDSGSPTIESGLNRGWINNPNSPTRREPFSKEMVDLIINHPNGNLIHTVFKSPHLTTEHGLNLVRRGHGNKLFHGIEDNNHSQPLLDKKKIVDAIVDLPMDPARQSLLRYQFKSWNDSLTPKFWDSVAQNELAEFAKDPTNSPLGDSIEHALSKTTAPATFLRQVLAMPHNQGDIKATAIFHPNLPQKDFDEHFVPMMAGGRSWEVLSHELGYEPLQRVVDFCESYKNSPLVQERHLEHVHNLLKESDLPGNMSRSLGQLYSSSKWSPERLARLWKEENVFSHPQVELSEDRDFIRRSFLDNPNTPDSVLIDYMARPTTNAAGVDNSDLELEKRDILDGRLHSKKLLQSVLGNTESRGIRNIALQQLAIYEPDRVYSADSDQERLGSLQGPVHIRPGVQKLRKLRDLIMAKAPERGEVKPKDLPAGDWSAGRLPNGNISAKKLNEFINSQPPTRYNFSHPTWNSHLQRHNTYSLEHLEQDIPPQNVFQLNVSDAMLDKMAEAGVDKTFRDMVAATHYSEHPVREHHTLGWVRYDGNAQDGFHVDEIQSDFGQSFVRQAAAQAQQAGHDEAGVADVAAKAQSKYPEEHYEIIKNILFQGRHPNEIVLEGFHQYLRDQGHHEAKVHMLHAETKAPISGQSLDKPLPAHMQFTYKQAPEKKFSMVPKVYGDLPSQTNPTLHGKPTWGGQVYKFELELAEWATDLGIEELAKSVEQGDFKGLIQAIDLLGGTVVDHRPHLEAHPTKITDEVNDYRMNVLESPTRNKRLSSKGLDGVSRKVVYKTQERRYLVKPYHERVIHRVRDWMSHPVQGWAEMTHQALYHAAGIGDLHQKVHVSEHPMSIRVPGKPVEGGYTIEPDQTRKEPALVIHLAEGFYPAIDYRYDSKHDQDLHDSIRKIGIMDMLTNNLDRHGLNLMINPETRQVLAIDHSRSFQYKVNSKPSVSVFTGMLSIPKEGEDDSLDHYIRQRAIAKFLPPPGRNPRRPDYDEAHDTYRKGYADIIENWWPKVSRAVRTELNKHLGQIKNPTLREHIRRNFHTRADLLDEMAHMGLDNYGRTDWGETPIQMFPYKG